MPTMINDKPKKNNALAQMELNQREMILDKSLAI
jgi:hypothetical protein